MVDTIDVEIKEFNDVNKATKLKHEKSEYFRTLSAGDTLYIGKSEDDLEKRINQHINLEEDSSTYSLKLSSANRKQLLSSKLRVVCFIMKPKYKNHIKILLPVVERYLHKELTPLVGSAKTS